MDWWQATNQPEAQRSYLDELGFSEHDAHNLEITMIHDFDDALRAESLTHVLDQQPGSLQTPASFADWPPVPAHVIAAADDRLFPLEFMPD